MSTNYEKLDGGMAKLTIEVSAEKFEEAIKKAYQKNRGRIQVPGFRKGKAPQSIIEKMYGPGIFYEDAADYAINESYDAAAADTDLEIMSRPSLDIVTIEKGKPFVYTAEVALRPEVTLKKVRGLEIAKIDRTVTDEDVDKAVNAEREKNARLVDVEDRPAQMGDTVTLDFEGFVDGEAFDGGKGANYALELGSKSFIPGFEEQLVGKNLEEACEVNVRFPDEYAEELAGKEAVFKCMIHKIAAKEMPEADDEFAKDVSEFDTLAEYKEDLKKNLIEEKEKSALTKKENAAIEALIKEMEADIPEAIIATELDNTERDYNYRLAQQGIDLATYLKYMGMTQDVFREQIRPQAETAVRTRLALTQVVRDENIEVSDEKFAEELAKMAKSYNMEEDKFKETMGEEMLSQMRSDLAIQAAVDLIRDEAVEVDMPEEKGTEEE